MVSSFRSGSMAATSAEDIRMFESFEDSIRIKFRREKVGTAYIEVDHSMQRRELGRVSRRMDYFPDVGCNAGLRTL